MTIRTIIVDDEPLARQRVSKLLEDYPDFKVIAECKNGTDAIKTIKKHKPDLIFLDIQMPGIDGFGVIEESKYKPLIIFITAYEHYALKAFDVKAIDYLMKPFDDDRFEESLDRAKNRIKQLKSASLNDKLMNLVSEFQDVNDSEYRREFSFKDNGREFEIETDEIIYLESDGNYLKINTKNDYHLYRSTMNSIEEELDPEDFLRIHRSFIINKHYVKNVNYLNNNEYQFVLRNGVEISSGRSYRDEIVEFMK